MGGVEKLEERLLKLMPCLERVRLSSEDGFPFRSEDLRVESQHASSGRVPRVRKCLGSSPSWEPSLVLTLLPSWTGMDTGDRAKRKIKMMESCVVLV